MTDVTMERCPNCGAYFRDPPKVYTMNEYAKQYEDKEGNIRCNNCLQIVKTVDDGACPSKIKGV